MNHIERHCDTCNDSFYETERNPSGGKKIVRLQHCRNAVYNSPVYTHQMLLEDWDKGFCRLWTPITEKGKYDYEILLEDGELFTCGHSIGNNAWISILRSLGCTIEEECISDEEMESMC